MFSLTILSKTQVTVAQTKYVYILYFQKNRYMQVLVIKLNNFLKHILFFCLLSTQYESVDSKDMDEKVHVYLFFFLKITFPVTYVAIKMYCKFKNGKLIIYIVDFYINLHCRKCFPWRGQPKGTMGKFQFSPFLCNEILIVVCDEISLNMSYNFDMMVASA